MNRREGIPDWNKQENDLIVIPYAWSMVSTIIALENNSGHPKDVLGGHSL